jgi:hypothetical protein
MPAAGDRSSRRPAPPPSVHHAPSPVASSSADVLGAVGAIETSLRQSRHRRLRAIGASVPSDVQGTALLGATMRAQLTGNETQLHRQRCDAVTGCFNAGLLHESLLAAADPSATGAAGVPAGSGGFAMPRSSLKDADARLAAAEAAAWTGQLLGVASDFVQPHVLGPPDGVVVPTSSSAASGSATAPPAAGSGAQQAGMSGADAQAVAFRVRTTVAHLLHGAVADAVESWPRLPLAALARSEGQLPRTAHVNPSLRSAYPSAPAGASGGSRGHAGRAGDAPTTIAAPVPGATSATSIDLATPWRVDQPISAFLPHALHQAAEGRVAALSARRAAGLLNVTRGRREDVDATSGSASDDAAGSGSEEAVDAVVGEGVEGDGPASARPAGAGASTAAATPAAPPTPVTTKTATSLGYPLAVTRLPVADSVVGTLVDRLKRGALLPPSLLSATLSHAVTSPDPADVAAGCDLVHHALASLPQVAFLLARHLAAYTQVRPPLRWGVVVVVVCDAALSVRSHAPHLVGWRPWASPPLPAALTRSARCCRSGGAAGGQRSEPPCPSPPPLSHVVPGQVYRACVDVLPSEALSRRTPMTRLMWEYLTTVHTLPALPLAAGSARFGAVPPAILQSRLLLDAPFATGAVDAAMLPLFQVLVEGVLTAPLPPPVINAFLRLAVANDDPAAALDVLALAERAAAMDRVLTALQPAARGGQPAALSVAGMAASLQRVMNAFPGAAGVADAVERCLAQASATPGGAPGDSVTLDQRDAVADLAGHIVALRRAVSPHGGRGGDVYALLPTATMQAVAQLLLRHRRHAEAVDVLRWHCRGIVWKEAAASAAGGASGVGHSAPPNSLDALTAELERPVSATAAAAPHATAPDAATRPFLPSGAALPLLFARHVARGLQGGLDSVAMWQAQEVAHTASLSARSADAPAVQAAPTVWNFTKGAQMKPHAITTFLGWEAAAATLAACRKMKAEGFPAVAHAVDVLHAAVVAASSPGPSARPAPAAQWSLAAAVLQGSDGASGSGGLAALPGWADKEVSALGRADLLLVDSAITAAHGLAAPGTAAVLWRAVADRAAPMLRHLEDARLAGATTVDVSGDAGAARWAETVAAVRQVGPDAAPLLPWHGDALVHVLHSLAAVGDGAGVGALRRSLLSKHVMHLLRRPGMLDAVVATYGMPRGAQHAAADGGASPTVPPAAPPASPALLPDCEAELSQLWELLRAVRTAPAHIGPPRQLLQRSGPAVVDAIARVLCLHAHAVVSPAGHTAAAQPTPWLPVSFELTGSGTALDTLLDNVLMEAKRCGMALPHTTIPRLVLAAIGAFFPAAAPLPKSAANTAVGHVADASSRWLAPPPPAGADSAAGAPRSRAWAADVARWALVGSRTRGLASVVDVLHIASKAAQMAMQLDGKLGLKWTGGAGATAATPAGPAGSGASSAQSPTPPAQQQQQQPECACGDHASSVAAHPDTAEAYGAAYHGLTVAIRSLAPVMAAAARNGVVDALAPGAGSGAQVPGGGSSVGSGAMDAMTTRRRALQLLFEMQKAGYLLYRSASLQGVDRLMDARFGTSTVLVQLLTSAQAPPLLPALGDTASSGAPHPWLSVLDMLRSAFAAPTAAGRTRGRDAAAGDGASSVADARLRHPFILCALDQGKPRVLVEAAVNTVRHAQDIACRAAGEAFSQPLAPPMVSPLRPPARGPPHRGLPFRAEDLARVFAAGAAVLAHAPAPPSPPPSSAAGAARAGQPSAAEAGKADAVLAFMLHLLDSGGSAGRSASPAAKTAPSPHAALRNRLGATFSFGVQALQHPLVNPLAVLYATTARRNLLAARLLALLPSQATPAAFAQEAAAAALFSAPVEASSPAAAADAALLAHCHHVLVHAHGVLRAVPPPPSTVAWAADFGDDSSVTAAAGKAWLAESARRLAVSAHSAALRMVPPQGKAGVGGTSARPSQPSPMPVTAFADPTTLHPDVVAALGTPPPVQDAGDDGPLPPPPHLHISDTVQRIATWHATMVRALTRGFSTPAGSPGALLLLAGLVRAGLHAPAFADAGVLRHAFTHAPALAVLGVTTALRAHLGKAAPLRLGWDVDTLPHLLDALLPPPTSDSPSTAPSTIAFLRAVLRFEVAACATAPTSPLQQRCLRAAVERVEAAARAAGVPAWSEPLVSDLADAQRSWDVAAAASIAAQSPLGPGAGAGVR